MYNHSKWEMIAGILLTSAKQCLATPKRCQKSKNLLKITDVVGGIIGYEPLGVP